MKRLFLYTVIAATLTISCSKADCCISGEYTAKKTLKISTEPTKTWIDGAQESASVQVWWSNGDRVAVNGQISSEYSSEEKSSSAEFAVNNVYPPYCLVYPHHCVKGVDKDGVTTLHIPEKQKYTENTFANGSLIMYGYSETESIACRYASGIIKVGLESQSLETISSISLKSLSEESPITGDFSIDFASGNLSASGGNAGTITFEMPDDGIQLEGGVVVYFFFVVKAGYYPKGFELKISDENKKVMRRFWLRENAFSTDNGVTVTAGTIVNLKTHELATDSREICSKEDWEEFIHDYTTGEQTWKDLWLSKKGTIIIGEDFSAESLTRLEELPADITIDGKGHTITLEAATGPLFGTVKGCVKNLTLSGSLKAGNPYEDGTAAFCRTLQNGILDNCINRMDISVDEGKTDLYIAASALVRSFHGGTIKNCRNSGDLNITTSQNDKSKVSMAGGVVAIVKDLEGNALISDCINDGNIVVTLDKPDNGSGISISHGGFAGIAGVVKDGTPDTFLTISRCTNNGNVIVRNAIDPTKTNHGKNVIGAGGIVGMCIPLNTDGASIPSSLAGWYMKIEDCSNTGNISNGLISFTATNEITKICSGGIAGVLVGNSTGSICVSGCSSTGAVSSYEGTGYIRAAFMNVAGGLCGMGAYLNATNCTITGEIGSLKRQHFSISSGIGLALGTFSLDNCNFGGNLSLIRVKRYSENNWSCAFTSPISGNCVAINSDFIKLSSSSVKNCRFKGSLTTNKDILSDALNANGAYKTSGYGEMETIVLSVDDFSAAIASASYDGTYVSFENNSFWEGE